MWRMCRQLRAYGGVSTFLWGLLKKPYYACLQRKLGFTTWHVNPIEWRPYSLTARRYVNELVRREGLRTVVDVGCGLAEVLAGIDVQTAVGFDVSREVLRAARRLHRKLDLREGSFAAIRGMRIDVLLALGFTHRIDPEALREDVYALLEGNAIRYILLDVCRIESTHTHDFDTMLAGRCRRVWCSETFGMGRRLLCYEDLRP